MKTLYQLCLLLLQVSMVLSDLKISSFHNPRCKLSCSEHINCSITIKFCSKENQTSSKDIPGAPTHLEANFTEIGENKARMLLKWRPPDDASYKQLDGFEVTVHESTTGTALRCYMLTPDPGWKQIHSVRKGGVSFFLDCLEVEFTAVVNVSIHSVPFDTKKPKIISKSFQYRKAPKKMRDEEVSPWKPDFELYSANYSGALLFANDYPKKDVDFYDVILNCEDLTSTISRHYRKVESMKEPGVIVYLSNGRLTFKIAGPIPEDKQCWFEVEPVFLKGDFGRFQLTRKFQYRKLDCWEPYWNPRLKGLQAIQPSSDDKNRMGRPLTHLVMERPISRSAFYRLMIFQQTRNEQGRRLIFNHTYDLSQKFDENNEHGVSYNENGYLEFIVDCLTIDTNYTFSMDALDSQKKPLPKVKRIDNEPLRIVGVDSDHPIIVESVLAPAMDNRLKIVVGLIITVFLLLVVSLLGYCLTQRGSARLRNGGSLWSPNNSQGLKILPIYCWEGESYQQAVKRHMGLVRQYACASWVPFPNARGNTRWQCWSSVFTWLLARKQESIGRDVMAEIKSSEVIIYLSPRLAYLMSLESTSSQPLNSCDLECWQLLSALRRLHCRGLGKRPHFVTFNCFNKAELVCLNAFSWMMGSASSRHYKDQRSHGEVSFMYGSSPRSQTHPYEDLQIMYHNSSAAEIQREETAELMPPLILAVQISGSWRLQNMQELLAQLQDIFRYPERQRLLLATVVVPTDWNTSPEVREIERHIGLTARLYLQAQGDGRVKNSRENPDDSDRGDGNHVCICPLPSPSNDCLQKCDDQAKDDNGSTICSSCGKMKLSGAKATEPGACISNIDNNSGAMAVCSKESQQKSQLPGTKVRSIPYSQFDTPYKYSDAQGEKECDIDSIESSEIAASVGFSSSHTERIEDSKAKVKLNSNSCRELNQYTIRDGNSLNSWANPKMMVLPPLGVKVAAQLDKHPIGFSQDIIPPDQCRSNAGFTLERMAQLNADNGWSEENLDTKV